MAVNRFTGSIDSNWGTAGNWSLVLIPTASDGNVVTFDGTSPNCTVNTSDRVCNNIDFTGYTNTITMSRDITVSGNITLSSTMLISGAGVLAINATGTITSNGKVWPNAFNFTPSTATITITGNFEITGNVGFAATGAGTPLTINGDDLLINGNLSVHTNGNRTTVGTADIYLKGSGKTWSGGSTSVLRNNVFVTGSYTISGTVHYNTGTLDVSGSGTLSGGTIQITQSTTLNCPTANFTNVTTASNALTLTINGGILTGTGTLSMGSNTTWDGGYGFSFPTVNLGTSAATARQIVLKSGLTYSTTSSFSGTQGVSPAHSTFSASTPGSVAYFNLTPGATCKLGYVDFTDIDASGGRTLRTFDGVITTSVNCQSFTDLGTITYAN